MVRTDDSEIGLPWSIKRALDAKTASVKEVRVANFEDKQNYPWLQDLYEWCQQLNSRHEENFILVGFLPSTWIISSTNGLRFVSVREKSLPCRLLTALADGAKSKQQLIETVWSYKYDPLRHDSLIYAAMRATRRVLESGSESWIRFSDGQYGLESSCRVMFRQVAPPVQQSCSSKPYSIGLNSRQLHFMETCRDKHPICTREYSGIYSISEETALRDLRELVQNRYLAKIGKGRNTTYLPQFL